VILGAALVALGLACWWVSTLGAGGGAILFLPVARLVIEPVDIPLVIAVASAISSVQRCWLYRHDIEAPVFLANVPGLIVGSVAGVWLLSGISPTVLGVLVGVFLVLFSLSRMLGMHTQLLPETKLWHFTLASLGTAALSAVVGAAGPTMNPFYLRARILKEAMIGTKAASSLAMQLVKGSAFAAIGMMTPEIVAAGVWVGLGALAGNWIGKRTLLRLTGPGFERIVHLALLGSGTAILWGAFRGAS
jgi:uncharacterized membrane protein YfcA